jgi:hypothetical protein
MSSRSRKKVIVITGAGAPLGVALARRLAEQGHRLILAGADDDRLQQIAAECFRGDAKAVAVPASVTSEADCDRLIDRAIEVFGRIDVLVMNPGGESTASDGLPSTECVRCAWPHLMVHTGKRGGQIVVFVTPGGTGEESDPTQWLESLRADAVKHGITLTAVHLQAAGHNSTDAMPVEESARWIASAIERRLPVLRLRPRGRIGAWLQRLATWKHNRAGGDPSKEQA